MSDIYEWFSLLCSRGPAFGYFPELAKCFVVVDERFHSEAESLFRGLGVRIVTGHRYLGGFIGDSSQAIYDWISKQESCVSNYKYLEISFGNIQFIIISRMHKAACIHFSTNL